ncbi:MAG: ATP-binding protein [Legionellales bacterium]|jgi:hypothetical protein
MTAENGFIGRKRELKKLNLLLKKTTASLVVVKGRRRIGKSRLIEEFGKHHKLYVLSGIAPTKKTTRQDQLNEFGWQLGNLIGQPAFKDNDWNDLFLRLASHTRQGPVIILLDEITWMGSKDRNFLGKLKNAWDLEFKKNPELILILCGSVSSWIEKNILSNTGFLGRISLKLTLEELPLEECNQFWDNEKYICAYEKFKILSVIGGIPKYLEEIQSFLPAEENIKNLCFDTSGLLFNEFDQIFTDIFSNRSEEYKKIVLSIADNHSKYEDICKKLNVKKSGFLSQCLNELVESGFIKRDFTWKVETGKASKLSHYRISDNYLRFYLKYILPNKDKVIRGVFENVSLNALPGWECMIGLQFENLVLNNRKKIMRLLNIDANDVIYDNPYFQNKTLRQESCQVDYLIQTRFDTLYIGEIKFSKRQINMDIIPEMEEKIKRIHLSSRFSCRPVLIHVNGVTEELTHSRFFSKIIDFSDLLEHDLQ